MKRDDDKPDYEVGYKKPPKHGQIKPGEKRSPGRPKGKSAKAIAKRLLSETVIVGGKKITRYGASVLRTWELGVIEKNTRALSETQKIGRECLDDPVEQRSEPQPSLSAADSEILRDYLARNGVPAPEPCGPTETINALGRKEGW